MSNTNQLERVQQSHTASKKRIQKELVKQSWEEVTALYNVIGGRLIDTLIAVNKAIVVIRESGVVVSRDVFTAIEGIKKDVDSFTLDLLAIRKRHDDKTGIIKKEDELMLCVSIFGDYETMANRFTSLIFTPMLTITECLKDIERVKEEANKNNEAIIAGDVNEQ